MPFRWIALTGTTDEGVEANLFFKTTPSGTVQAADIGGLSC